MHIFAIADLHMDSTGQKPMHIFGENWIDHESKIFNDWRDRVKSDDLVLLPGDISWAMKIDDAKSELSMIDSLPGHKIMIRGNHDYWWSTKKKMDALKFESIDFLTNECIKYDDFSICGVRGWDSYLIKSDENEKKIYDRELLRFEMSLKNIGNFDGTKIAMLHFPPFDLDKSPNDFVDLMKKYNIDICLYGHLHGKEGHKLAFEGEYFGIKFYCVASDFLDFKLRLII